MGHLVKSTLRDLRLSAALPGVHSMRDGIELVQGRRKCAPPPLTRP
jgi:hypothetical protein